MSPMPAGLRVNPTNGWRACRATIRGASAPTPRVPNGVMHELKRFHYVTAWSAHPGALAALMKPVDVSQVPFGSDYPYRSGEDHVKGIIEYGYSQAALRAIGRDNALRLMPQWRA